MNKPKLGTECIFAHVCIYMCNSSHLIFKELLLHVYVFCLLLILIGFSFHARRGQLFIENSLATKCSRFGNFRTFSRTEFFVIVFVDFCSSKYKISTFPYVIISDRWSEILQHLWANQFKVQRWMTRILKEFLMLLFIKLSETVLPSTLRCGASLPNSWLHHIEVYHCKTDNQLQRSMLRVNKNVDITTGLPSNNCIFAL